MIADTTFLTHFLQEGWAGRTGPVRAFVCAATQRTHPDNHYIHCRGRSDFSVLGRGWAYLKAWKIYPLHRGVAEVAADIDGFMLLAGQRLGENDNWIAAFC